MITSREGGGNGPSFRSLTGNGIRNASESEYEMREAHGGGGGGAVTHRHFCSHRAVIFRHLGERHRIIVRENFVHFLKFVGHRVGYRADLYRELLRHHEDVHAQRIDTLGLGSIIPHAVVHNAWVGERFSKKGYRVESVVVARLVRGLAGEGWGWLVGKIIFSVLRAGYPSHQ